MCFRALDPEADGQLLPLAVKIPPRSFALGSKAGNTIPLLLLNQNEAQEGSRQALNQVMVERCELLLGVIFGLLALEFGVTFLL